MNGIENSMQGTAALLDLYREVPEIQKEFSIFKPVAIHINAMVPISTHKQISNTSDFKGLRLRTAATYAIEWLDLLGASGMSFSITDSYENMSKHVCDGLLNDWVNLNANKLYEVTDYVLDVNAGAAIGFVAMNQEKYDALPADLQELIDNSFEDLSFRLAEAFADSKTIGIENAAEYQVEVYMPTEEMKADMEAAGRTVIGNWITARMEEGVDGQAIFDLMQEKLAEHQAEYSVYN